MALGATHIRFALDLKSEYDIKNIKKYISGTVYPDSRYVTDIDRELTHGDHVLSASFAKDDFKKGWQVHLICDMIQNKKRKELLPEITVPHSDKWNIKGWVNSTAAKIIQDMKDAQSFDIQAYLKYLNEYIINPNNENINDIKKYYQIQIDLYKDKQIITIEDNFIMWKTLGISKEQADKLKRKLTALLKDKKLVKRIEEIYSEMLKSYKVILK